MLFYIAFLALYSIIVLGDYMFTPLGIKTDYSLLKSLIKVEDLVLYAKNNNYDYFTRKQN